MITFSPVRRTAYGHLQQSFGVLQFSGSYTTGGDDLPNNIGLGTNKPPIAAQIIGESAAYIYDLNTAKRVKVIASASYNEIGAGAYPVGVLNDLVFGMFQMDKF